VTLVAARYLGPEDFGRYSYAVALVLLLAGIANLGLQGIVTRDLVDEEGNRNEILGSAVAIRALGAVGSTVLAVALISLLRPSDVEMRLMVVLLCIGVLLQPLRVLDLFYESEVASKYTVAADGLAGVTWLLIIGALIASTFSVIWFSGAKAIQLALSALLLLAIYFRQGGRPTEWQFDSERAKSLLRKSWPLALANLGVVVYLKIDQVMLGQMTGDAEVGTYAIAAQLSEATYFIPAVVASSLFPSLVALRRSDERTYRSRLISSYAGLAWAGVAIATLVLLVSGPVIELLFGEEYRGAAPILVVHIWASPFIFMRAILSRWLIIEELYVFSLVSHLAGALVNVAANLILIPRMAGFGAALATVISYATASYFSLFVSRRTRPAAGMMTRALLMPLKAIGTPKGQDRGPEDDQREDNEGEN